MHVFLLTDENGNDITYEKVKQKGNIRKELLQQYLEYKNIPIEYVTSQTIIDCIVEKNMEMY